MLWSISAQNHFGLKFCSDMPLFQAKNKYNETEMLLLWIQYTITYKGHRVYIIL
jgi:hypothetical protein